MSQAYVLHIPKWYPNIDDPLDAIFIKRHIQSTLPYFHAVVLFAKVTSSKVASRFYDISEIQEGACTTYRAYYKTTYTGIRLLDRLIKATIYFFAISKFLKHVLEKHGTPALIHSHILLRPALLAYFISRILKIPFVITEHSTFFTSATDKSAYTLMNLIRRFVVLRADAIITVSSDLEQGMKRFRLYNSKYYRIFNNVDLNEFYYAPKILNKVCSLLHVSEFKNDHKNIIGILEVIHRLKKNQYQFVFNLVGYGKDLVEILDFIKKHDMTDYVIYHGTKTGAELAAYYRSADALVLFSNKENMPCVIAESLCCGTPVISTNVGGISEVINATNGILIERYSKDQLYLAIEQIIQHPNTFNSNSISQKAARLFSYESIGNMLNKVYLDCIETKQIG